MLPNLNVGNCMLIFKYGGKTKFQQFNSTWALHRYAYLHSISDSNGKVITWRGYRQGTIICACKIYILSFSKFILIFVSTTVWIPFGITQIHLQVRFVRIQYTIRTREAKVGMKHLLVCNKALPLVVEAIGDSSCMRALPLK